jgi:hypothetical protein
MNGLTFQFSEQPRNQHAHQFRDEAHQFRDEAHQFRRALRAWGPTADDSTQAHRPSVSVVRETNNPAEDPRSNDYDANRIG